MVTQHTLPTSTGKEVPCIPNRKWHHFTTPAGERKDSSSSSNSPANGTCPNSTNKKPLYSELSVYSTGLVIYHSPSQVQKRASSPLFLWTSVLFTITLNALNCNSLLFLSQPILLEKYLAGYLLKVNSIPHGPGKWQVLNKCLLTREEDCNRKGGSD